MILARPSAILFAAAGVLALVRLGHSAPNRPIDAPNTIASKLSFKDLAGQAFGPAGIKSAKATVFIFSSIQCPLSNIYTPRIVALASAFKPRMAQFFLVDSNPEDSADAIRKDAAIRGYTAPLIRVVKDDGTRLADILGARCTPEVVILDSSGEVRYRGRIDDNRDRTKVVRHDAQAAMECVLADKPVEVPRTLAAGCAIFRDTPPSASKRQDSANSTAITYAKDIAPILNRNCVVCHRRGEVGPFPLETYAEARTWAAQIRDYTARRIMPPWKAVPGHGDFFDSRVLTDDDIGKISRWQQCGTPQGTNLAAIAAAPTFPHPEGWSLGKPDMVVQPVRPYHLEAEGKDIYRNFVLPIDFKEERFLTAMEFKPGNRSVVHHIVTYFDPSGKSAEMDGKEKEPGYTVPGTGIGVLNAEWGEVWVPGRTPRFMPEGVAIRIPKGAKLVMQVHYHKNGAPQTDSSRVALYFSRGPIQKQVLTWPVGNAVFELKPGGSRQEVKTWFTVPADAHLLTMFPHMHLLGKEMKVVATLPDGTKRDLIWINDWDFNWQETYVYREPVSLPKGTRVDVAAIYDNSESNPHQVFHPPKTIRFGEQTTDEMCFAIMGLTFDNQRLNVTPPVQSP